MKNEFIIDTVVYDELRSFLGVAKNTYSNIFYVKKNNSMLLYNYRSRNETYSVLHVIENNLLTYRIAIAKEKKLVIVAEMDGNFPMNPINESKVKRLSF